MGNQISGGEVAEKLGEFRVPGSGFRERFFKL
jgi:hypothetical protein